MPRPRTEDSNEYKTYMHSNAWLNGTRIRRLELDKYTCQVCGEHIPREEFTEDRHLEVHHLTYAHLGEEFDSDLVTLCRRCHQKAEDFYEAKLSGHKFFETPKDGFFLAALREDALTLAPQVMAYIKKVRGEDVIAFLKLRQPNSPESKRHWVVLQRIIRALCWKRYCYEGQDDRLIMATDCITAVLAYTYLEHDCRNVVQDQLQLDVKKMEEVNKVRAKTLGRRDYAQMTVNELNKQGNFGFKDTKPLNKLRNPGIPAGPTPRETVFYYCSLMTNFGIEIPQIFDTLTDEDYEQLNQFAAYVRSLSA